MREFWLEDESATLALGDQLAKHLRAGSIIYLEGALGAGKTTLTRGVLESMGYSGLVKSPTYTLIEAYQIGELNVHHFDLYRLGEPEELEFMGIRDYFDQCHMCLIEWPQKGMGYLPKADMTVSLMPDRMGRKAILAGVSESGCQVLANFKL